MRLHTRASTQGGAFTQRWFYAERWFYKGMLLLTNFLTQRYFQRRDAFSHGCFKIQILLHRDDFAKRNFWTQAGFHTSTFTPLHRDVSTQVFLHVNTSTIHSALRTHSFTLRFSYTQAHLHRGTLTHSRRHVYMQILLRGGVHFACVFFTCTDVLSQGCFDHTCFYTDIFTRRHLCTEWMPLYTQILLQRDDLTLSSLTQKPKQTEVLLQRNACARPVFSYGHFHTDILLHYFLWRTRVWRKEFSKHMQNHSFTTAFDGRDAFRGKGLAQDKPTLQFDLNAWRSAFRAKGSRFADINPRCPAARREKWETIKVVNVSVSKKLISTCVFTSATPYLNISTSRFPKNDFRLHL